MRYQIQTMPIIEAFKNGCDCPLCFLREKTDSRHVSTYLNDAVMEPDFRIRVNKYGFCPSHMQQLYSGKNKLSLALQLNTHTNELIKNIPSLKNAKSAKALADLLDKNYCSCVICEETDEVLARYAYTIVQMFAFEAGFSEVFKEHSKGFCMPHFALLLHYCDYAKKQMNEFLDCLVTLQKNSLSALNKITERFTLMFDYNSLDKSFLGSEEAVKNAVNKLKGELIK